MPFVVVKLTRDAPCQCTLFVLVPPLLADAAVARHGNATLEGLDGASLSPQGPIWRAARKQDERARCGGGWRALSGESGARG